MAGSMRGGVASVGAPIDPGERELMELERAAKMKQAKLKALMYAKYLTMYGGDPATMQGILGSEGGRYGLRSGYGGHGWYGGSSPGPSVRGG